MEYHLVDQPAADMDLGCVVGRGLASFRQKQRKRRSLLQLVGCCRHTLCE